MGISDRDYNRNRREPTFVSGEGWDVITWLIAINVATYVIQVLWTHDTVGGPDSVFENWFSLEPSQVLRGQIWRLLTYDFLHSVHNVWHIVMNMYVLFLTGRKLLTVMTEREFLLFYLCAAVTSGLAFVLWQLGRGSDIPAIGASGAVAAVMVLYAIHWPKDVWMIFMIIPVPVMVLVVLYAILDLHPILFELGYGIRKDNVAHMAHLGGMAFAALYHHFHWRLEPLIERIDLTRMKKWFKRKPKLRVHRSSPDDDVTSSQDLQAQVDALLEKIHLQGEGSLTAAEREVLNTASRQLRNRRGDRA